MADESNNANLITAELGNTNEQSHSQTTMGGEQVTDAEHNGTSSTNPTNIAQQSSSIPNDPSSNHSNGNGHCSNGKENSDYENDNLSQQFETLKMMTGTKTPYEIHSRRDRETIRLIGQHLIKLGLERSARELVNESGCELDHPTAMKFRAAVLEGDWDAANDLLTKLRPFTPSTKNFYLLRYWILEQKFFEALEDRRNLDALHCLKREIVPLNFRKKKITELCHYFMLNSIQELRDMARWPGKGQASRNLLLRKVQKRLPSEIMLEPDRLTKMFNQAFDYQRSLCLFHNQGYFSYNNPGELSLLSDHSCDRKALPGDCTQILEEHVDEVWFCAFSKCGRFLATASKDRSVNIWDVCPKTFTLKLKHRLKEHPYHVGFVAWSPDSNWLLTLGTDGTSEFWIWSVQEGTVKNKINKDSDESITTAAWHFNSKSFVVAGTRGHFHSVRLDIGSIVDTWEGVRIQALVCKNDNRTVLAADTQCRIRAFVFGQNTDELIIREDHNITSFCCDNTFHYAVVNVEMQGLHLWDIRDRVLLRKLQGNMHGYYTIHSCFGGVDQNFVASGCEHNRVIIWNRNHNNPIMDLRGHTKTVNCVSWNPVFPQMLASASDDTSVRIWCSENRLDDYISEHLETASSMNNCQSPKPLSKASNHSEDLYSSMDYADSEFDYSSDEEIEAIVAAQSTGNNVSNNTKKNDIEDMDEDGLDGDDFIDGLVSRPVWFNRARCEQNRLIGYMVHLNERLRAFRERRSVKRRDAQAKTASLIRQQSSDMNVNSSDPLLLICDSSESDDSPSSSSTSPSSVNSP